MHVGLFGVSFWGHQVGVCFGTVFSTFRVVFGTFWGFFLVREEFFLYKTGGFLVQSGFFLVFTKNLPHMVNNIFSFSTFAVFCVCM